MPLGCEDSSRESPWARRLRRKGAPEERRRITQRPRPRRSRRITPSTRARRSPASWRSASPGPRGAGGGARATAAAQGVRSRPTRASPSPTSSIRRPCARPTRCGTWATPAGTRSPAARSPTMYRGRLWTMRQFAGFGSPEDTNRRFKYLLEHGVTGLSTAFDMPALMGYDADHPMSRGEVGKEGVAISTLRDFEVLFDGHPARRRHDLDDHQRDRRHRARDVRGGRGAAGRRRARSSAARSRTTC